MDSSEGSNGSGTGSELPFSSFTTKGVQPATVTDSVGVPDREGNEKGDSTSTSVSSSPKKEGGTEGESGASEDDHTTSDAEGDTIDTIDEMTAKNNKWRLSVDLGSTVMGMGVENCPDSPVGSDSAKKNWGQLRTLNANGKIRLSSKKRLADYLREYHAKLRGADEEELKKLAKVEEDKDKKEEEAFVTDVASDEGSDLKGGAKGKKPFSFRRSCPVVCVCTTRAKVHQIFEEPSSSFLARCINLFILMFIVISTVSLIVETLPELHDNTMEFFIIEIVVTFVFVVEIVIRWTSSPKPWKWPFEVLNVIDLLAVAPFAVEVLPFENEASALRAFRLVRVVRVFRIFKMGRHSASMKIFVKVMSKSGDALLLLGFYLGIAVIVFSSMIYFAERGDWNDEDEVYEIENTEGVLVESKFQSIPQSFYWCVATMTSVGYGDDVPFTSLGRTVAVLAMIFGILVMSFPISVIGTQFAGLWSERKIEKKLQKEKIKKEKKAARLKKMEDYGGYGHLEDPLPVLLDALRSKALALEYERFALDEVIENIVFRLRAKAKSQPQDERLFLPGKQGQPPKFAAVVQLLSADSARQSDVCIMTLLRTRKYLESFNWKSFNPKLYGLGMSVDNNLVEPHAARWLDNVVEKAQERERNHEKANPTDATRLSNAAKTVLKAMALKAKTPSKEKDEDKPPPVAHSGPKELPLPPGVGGFTSPGRTPPRPTLSMGLAARARKNSDESLAGGRRMSWMGRRGSVTSMRSSVGSILGVRSTAEYLCAMEKLKQPGSFTHTHAPPSPSTAATPASKKREDKMMLKGEISTLRMERTLEMMGNASSMEERGRPRRHSKEFLVG